MTADIFVATTRPVWGPPTERDHASVVVRRRPPTRSRGAGRWRRRLLTVIATALAVALGALGATSLYLAHRLVDPRPVTDAYPLRVVAIDTAAATVTLSNGPDAGEPGSFRLSWPAGHAVAGPVIAEQAATVLRSLTAVTGSLRPGQRVGIQPNPYTGDPRSALGLGYTDVTVMGATGVLPAWFVAGRRQTWVLLIHGLDGSRSDTLPAMATLNALGFPMLAITYRNDPGAAPSADHRSHLGDTEWQDIAAAIGYAQTNGAHGVVLYGWSLGAGMAIVTSEHAPPRTEVRALVLDSPVLDWRATLDANSARHRIPAVITWSAKTILASALGVNIDRYREHRLAAALTTPALVIEGSADSVTPPAVSDAFARARPDLVTYLRVAGADHVSGADTDPEGYAAAVRHLLGPLP